MQLILGSSALIRSELFGGFPELAKASGRRGNDDDTDFKRDGDGNFDCTVS
jgi:hypothetical protein